MTDLSKLVVSLTKHGAHKVAALLKAFPPEEVLNNTWGTYDDIHIDRAQTAKTLSADEAGNVPPVWQQVKRMDSQSVDLAVLVAIIFSHHSLIETMIAGGRGNRAGSVPRQGLDTKVYTNLACILQELGLATNETPTEVFYDWTGLIDNEQLSELIREILQLKLKTAGWNGENFITECLRLKINEVFALDSTEFTNWLTDEVLHIPIQPIDVPAAPFSFRSGHNPRIEGEVERGGTGRSSRIALLHNEIQNSLYQHLTHLHGRDNVGSEVPTGYGLSAIDLVVQTSNGDIFYEIKTYVSIKACLRAAIGQILEYAYWPDRINAMRLIIVSQNAATPDTERYLQHLRHILGLPIHYQQFDLKEKRLGIEY